MTIRAIGVLRVQVVLRTCGLLSANTVCNAVTRETKLRNAAGNQHAWIRRTVRRMTATATLSLNRCMLVDERPLLINVTLEASCVGPCGESRLFELKTTMRIMAVATLHRAFEDLVMER